MQKDTDSDFSSIWLEAVLTQGVLRDADLIFLLKQFSLGSFEEYQNDPTGLKDMVFVLLDKAPHEKLLKEVREVINEEYPDRLSFEEAADIYKRLVVMENVALVDFYTVTLGKPALKHSADAYDLAVLILGELSKLPREEAAKLLQ